jgi:hypothetical protein
MRATKRLGAACGVVATVLLLSGCGQWYGTVRFQDFYSGGGLGGYGEGTHVTTYTVEPGQKLAQITARVDATQYDGDGWTFPNGCEATFVRLHGEATAWGYVHVVPGTDTEPAKLYVGLLSRDLTFPLSVTEASGFDDPDCETLDEWPYGRGSFATRGLDRPQPLTGFAPVGPGSADGGYVSYQDDCYRFEINDVTSCLVVYDLHPQAAPTSVM